MTDDSDPGAFVSENLDVRVSDDGLVLSATITRPERRNALNETVLEGLHSVVAADESAARVLVVEAEGDVFSAGGDFTEMSIGGSAQEYRERFGGLSEVMLAFRESSA